MSSDISRPTSPLSPIHDAFVVRNNPESPPVVGANAQNGRKSLPHLSTTYKDNLPLEPPNGNNTRRVSRSLPLSEKSWRRFRIGRRLQLPRRRRQIRPVDWNFSPFGDAMEVRDGQDRRLQAQHSRGRHDSCEMDTHPRHSPLGTEAMTSLAKAALMLATDDLDRLSERARARAQKHRELVEEQRTVDACTDKADNT
ncbi:hypothetical protein E4U21_000220 [Claviceps maximensis]|nr:hypothetical protein E4U21_000220 [Claviceps maximensis]